uniref:Uncharacterized protein n=1 Tax=Cannabis sativa TaxID=3483 RepID=A0A803RBS1_CANSA
MLFNPLSLLGRSYFRCSGSFGVLNSPLILIQVTRLACGGFIFALRLNHTMAIAAGLVQFMTALGEIARGADSPSIPPVWQRELLNARNPPRVTCEHREYDQVVTPRVPSYPWMTWLTAFLGPTEVWLRKLVPPQFHKASTFEFLLHACGNAACSFEDGPRGRGAIICIVNERSRFNPPLPRGYYGNGFAFPVAVTLMRSFARIQLGMHWSL